MKKGNAFSREIKVGVRTQLCKECTDFRDRLCEVDGQPALFHRWVEEVSALLKVDFLGSWSEVEILNKRFKADGIVPPGCSTDLVRSTFALVEYRDGTVAKVRPESIRFVDVEG